VPRDGERRLQLGPQPGVQAAAAPGRARHALHVVVDAPRRVAAVHVIHVREAVLVAALDRVVVGEEGVQTESGMELDVLNKF
jgi:hypothetical protein